jgi:hypothetical protein
MMIEMLGKPKVLFEEAPDPGEEVIRECQS